MPRIEKGTISATFSRDSNALARWSGSARNRQMKRSLAEKNSKQENRKLKWGAYGTVVFSQRGSSARDRLARESRLTRRSVALVGTTTSGLAGHCVRRGGRRRQ